jgi:hypothetical protein
VRRFKLHRHTDVTGVSGAGWIAEGVEFSDGTVALRWLSDWPTSVVFHDRGMEAVDAVHGHGGSTEVVWIDAPFVCAICLDRFSDNVELMQHLNEHARNVEAGGRA